MCVFIPLQTLCVQWMADGRFGPRGRSAVLTVVGTDVEGVTIQHRLVGAYNVLDLVSTPIFARHRCVPTVC